MKDNALELLKIVPVFSELADEDLVPLAQVAVPRRFPAGTHVFNEGDRGDTCFVIKSGSARVTRQHSDGRIITLASLEKSDIFGELAMFDGEVRSASVEALDDLEVLALVGKDVRLLLAKHPHVTVSCWRHWPADYERQMRGSRGSRSRQLPGGWPKRY